MLAYTGLETVANLAEETRRPGVQLPKSLFGGIGAVVAVYVGIAVVGLMAFPVRDGTTELGNALGASAPLMGIVAALDPHLPDWLHTPLRVYVGLSGAFILLLAAATSISGFGRLAYSLGEHGQLPRAFGRLHRRTLVSPRGGARRRRPLRPRSSSRSRRWTTRSPSSPASSASASCSRSRPRSSP